MHESSQAGSRLTSLYEAHASDVFRYALHLTGRREDAEDVVQFVFLQAYRLLESGGELVTPRAWLIRATKHRSLNLIRDRREAPATEAELAVPARPAADAAEAEALADVRSSLWALPESQHHAFVLRHWSGLHQDEIAEVLGTTTSAVESLLVRARTALMHDQDEASECRGVRRRLVEALVPTPGQTAHISHCRRCRTAQARLRHAAEFASVFALVPSPHVAHALASVVPGFGASTAAAATTTTAAAGAAGGGTAGGAGVASVSAAAKVTLATKLALATATTVVALGATHPVRSAVTGIVLGHPAAAVPAVHKAAGTASAQMHASAPAPGTPAGRGQGQGHPAGKGAAAPPAKGKAKGHGKAHGAGKAHGNGNGAGPPAAPGNGNGNGQAKGKANGKAASTKTTPPGQAKPKPVKKPKPARPAGGNGQANGNGNGNGAGNGNGKGGKKS